MHYYIAMYHAHNKQPIRLCLRAGPNRQPSSCRGCYWSWHPGVKWPGSKLARIPVVTLGARLYITAGSRFGWCKQKFRKCTMSGRFASFYGSPEGLLFFRESWHVCLKVSLITHQQNEWVQFLKYNLTDRNQILIPLTYWAPVVEHILWGLLTYEI